MTRDLLESAQQAVDRLHRAVDELLDLLAVPVHAAPHACVSAPDRTRRTRSQAAAHVRVGAIRGPVHGPLTTSREAPRV